MHSRRLERWRRKGAPPRRGDGLSAAGSAALGARGDGMGAEEEGGELVQALLRLAWPCISVGLLRSMYNATDAFWIGRLGTASLSGVVAGSFPTWVAMLLCDAGAVGVLTLSAEAEGADQRSRIGRTVMQGLWAGAALSVGLLAVSPFCGAYVTGLGFAPGSDEWRAGAQYLAAVLATMAPYAFSSVTTKALQGIGLMKAALATTALTVTLNAVLDPLLIWGLGPVPALGVTGAALGTAIAAAVGCGVHLVILARAGAPLVPARPSLATLRQLLSIGVPMSASGVLSCLAFMCLAKVLTGLDTAFVAALGISHRIEGFVYQTAVGFKVATSSLVGQSIGAGSPVRAQLAAFTALRLVIATMIPIALGMFVFSESLAQIFTSDPVVSGAANSYLRICAASLPLLGMEMAMNGAFAGWGYTVPVMWITGVLSVMRVPMAMAMVAAGFEFRGVWLAIAVTQVAKGLGATAWFRAFSDRRLAADLEGGR